MVSVILSQFDELIRYILTLTLLSYMYVIYYYFAASLLLLYFASIVALRVLLWEMFIVEERICFLALKVSFPLISSVFASGTSMLW